jgi:hypothetical protein
MFSHVILVEFLQQRSHCLVECGFRRVRDLLRSNLLAKDAEVIGVGDVEEVNVLLHMLAGIHGYHLDYTYAT